MGKYTESTNIALVGNLRHVASVGFVDVEPEVIEEAALRLEAIDAPKPSKAWVIKSRSSLPLFWAPGIKGWDEANGETDGWSLNLANTVRFTRRIDAERVRNLISTEHFVEEHTFVE